MENFNKKDTSIVKGIAILMLIGYHCFSSVKRLCGYPVDFGIIPQNIAIYIFESMNICVGMFAFLSVFGITKIFGNVENRKKNTREFILKRLIKLLASFAIPYIICVSITLLFTDYNPYGKGMDFFFNMICDMLGLGGILGTPLMVGTWWYMSLAILIILLTPLTIRIYEEYGLYIFIPYLIPILFNPNFYSDSSLSNMTRWLLIIPIGVVFAKENIFEKLKNKKISRNTYLNKIIKFIILTIVLVLFIKFRTTTWTQKYIFYIISSVLPVYFIYYLYEFLVDIPIFSSIMDFIGKNSANIFYVHTFIRYIWFKDFTYSLINPILILGFVFITSLIISILIEIIKKIFKYDKGMNFIIKKLTESCNKVQSEL